jgi:hypothetical protein
LVTRVDVALRIVFCLWVVLFTAIIVCAFYPYQVIAN